MSLTKDLSKIGSIANALYSSITANTTAITSINAAVVDINTGTNIASASTINLNTATGNRVHVTGTTTITAVTLTRGPRTVIFDDVLTLTHHATTNNLPGAANITTAAGDRAIYEGDGTTVFCVNYIKASGQTVVGGSSITSTGSTITANTTLTSASPGYQPIAMTALGRSVTLPDATTVTVGSPRFYLNNASGGYPVGIRNSAGTLLMAIAAGGTAFVSCQDISSAAGVWNITGNNLEPGLITIDNMFSSTYSAAVIMKPFVVFDSAKSLHFLELSSGFAAVAVDNTTGAVGTPVTVSATASMVPRTAFMITSTTAIVFYSNSTGALTSVVLSLSGATTLTVGTASSTLTATGAGMENFSVAPKIAQLAATLYLVSYATATGAGTIDSTTTYALTATTALVIYMSGAAAPYTISAVVISVTNANPPVCTVGTPQAGGTRTTASAVASCLLSSTKALITPDTGNTVVGAQAFTISGTSVSVGAVLTVETVAASTQLTYVGVDPAATRYTPILFPLSATTALLSYIVTNVSRAVHLTESAGTMTNGGILFRSITSASQNNSGNGAILPQGTGEFLAIVSVVGSTTLKSLSIVPHKISGTAITSGSSLLSPDIGGNNAGQTYAVRLTSNNYVMGFASDPGIAKIKVVQSNGDYINDRGSMAIPSMTLGTAVSGYPVSAVASNRIVFLGSAGRGTTVSTSTLQMRLINLEIAS